MVAEAPGKKSRITFFVNDLKLSDCTLIRPSRCHQENPIYQVCLSWNRDTECAAGGFDDSEESPAYGEVLPGCRPQDDMMPLSRMVDKRLMPEMTWPYGAECPEKRIPFSAEVHRRGLYGVMKMMLQIGVCSNVADYRLLRCRVLDGLESSRGQYVLRERRVP